MKAEERSAATPIILITAGDITQAQILQGYAAGAVDYLTKPVVPEILRAKVSTFFELCRKNEQLKRQIDEISRLLQSMKQSRQVEANLLEQNQWFRTTLASIGDGVIATDAEGRVAFLNEVAEQLSGWSQTEALGQDLSRVFNIINERTRRPTQNPI